MDGGFEPGRTYQISYRAQNLAGRRRRPGRVPRHGVVAEVQPAALVASALRHTRSGRRRAGAFCGRFCITDSTPTSRAARCSTASMAHIAGGARLSINERGATPNSLGDVLRDDVSVRGRGAARSDHGQDRRPARQRRARAATRRRSSTRTRSSSTGAAAAPPRSCTRRRTARANSAAARQRARLFPRRHAALAGAVPAAQERHGQQRDNPVRVPVDDARAARGDGRSGSASGTAPPREPASAVQGRRVTIVAGRTSRSRRFRACSRRASIPGRDRRPHAAAARAARSTPTATSAPASALPDVAVPLATYTGWNFRSPASRRHEGARGARRLVDSVRRDARRSGRSPAIRGARSRSATVEGRLPAPGPRGS